MAKCHENRRRRLKRRRAEERRKEQHRDDTDDAMWICGCGNIIDVVIVLAIRTRTAPRRLTTATSAMPPVDFDDCPDFYDDDYAEPIGSCEWCGTNLYADDDDELCDQCLWHSEQNKGGEDCGFQPVI